MPARILVIEDNPANMELMVYLLKAYGHEPLLAHNGRDGIELASKAQPDLIICDIHLPQLDGYDVVNVLKTQADWQVAPIIAVTALAMVGDQEKLLAAGFDGYISKPIDPETFVPTLEQHLQQDRTRSESSAQLNGQETRPHYNKRSNDGDHSDR